MMDKVGVIKAIHFLKVSHHGSHTGMPETEILEKLMPLPSPDGRPRQSAVSTYPGTYDSVPDEPTLTELRRRSELRSTADLGPGDLWIDFHFAP